MTLDGQIDENLPDGRFRVRLEKDHAIIVCAAGKMRRFRIHSVANDRIQAKMTPDDLGKGRLAFRERTPAPSARASAAAFGAGLSQFNHARAEALRSRISCTFHPRSFLPPSHRAGRRAAAALPNGDRPLFPGARFAGSSPR